MIVTIELPGSLAQGYLISERDGMATINASGLILTGRIVRRAGRWLQAQADGSGGGGDTGETIDGPSAAKIRGVQE